MPAQQIAAGLPFYGATTILMRNWQQFERNSSRKGYEKCQAALGGGTTITKYKSKEESIFFDRKNDHTGQYFLLIANRRKFQSSP